MSHEFVSMLAKRFAEKSITFGAIFCVEGFPILMSYW